MRRLFRGVQWSILGLSLVVASVVGVANAQATSVQVSAVVVGNPPVDQGVNLELHGFAAPSATMTVSRSGTQIATGTASATGAYSFILSNQPTGQQTYVVTGTDTQGNALASVTFVFTLTQGTTTIVEGAFLGPSISVDKQSVMAGQPVTVSGITIPFSTVTTAVHSSDVLQLSTTADAAGLWAQSINTSVLSVGTHSATATAQTGSTESADSSTVEFTVGAADRCDGKKTADLNCDSRVNLTDFSILLFFWKSNTPANARADINGDGEVTIVDFSIMLYQWTN